MFIAAHYPKMQFEFSQSMIAASAVHCVKRIRGGNGGYWSGYIEKEVTIGAYNEESLRQCSLRLMRKYVGMTMKKEKKYEERLWLLERKFSGNAYHQAALVRLNTSSSKTRQPL